MAPVIIYSPVASARLDHVLKWLFGQRLQVPYVLMHDAAQVPADTFFIAYGAPGTQGLYIPASGLLGKTGIKRHEIPTGKWYNIPTLYHVPGAADTANTLPFDIFSAIFFLLSRYEEYYSYTPDKHGRYPATESEMYKHHWLRRPLVDEWVHMFRNILQGYAGITIPPASFSIIPTYDIDIAYSYRGKGLQRNIGGLAKDIFRGELASASERIAVLLGSKKDPYDSFDLLFQLHKKTNTHPLYFILCAQTNSPYDKNILPSKPLMQKLIRQLQKDGGVFIHPSYHAQNGLIMRQEKKLLEQIITTTITSSRQHYIKNILPATYHQLIQQGITDDYSMGYATHLGFRAGTGHSFLWYDLSAEKETTLTLHPFCFMDTAAHYEEHLDVASAFSALAFMAGTLKENTGQLITIFHNFSLGTSPQWKGWAAAYQEFVAEFA